MSKVINKNKPKNKEKIMVELNVKKNKLISELSFSSKISKFFKTNKFIAIYHKNYEKLFK